MEVSNAFVVAMGMGVTFVGLTLIIFLTMLMGRIITAFEKKAPQPEAVRAPAPAVPAGPADGVPNEVKVAIMAALAQQPGFRLESVTNVEIRKIG